MSDEKHTAEPWQVGVGEDNGLPCVDAYDETGHLIELCECWGEVVDKFETEQSRANARRIVACVNACAGIPTEELEAVGRSQSQQDRLQTLEAVAIVLRHKTGETK